MDLLRRSSRYNHMMTLINSNNNSNNNNNNNNNYDDDYDDSHSLGYFFMGGR